MELIKPNALKPNDKIGIFTPSFPAHLEFKEKFLHGIEEIKRMGFEVVLGSLTEKMMKQGYRSGTPKERAEEFMQLIENKNITCLMATIGGICSNSMIEYLDFDKIAANPKVITGYSDVTSLHLAIHNYTGLITFYGPAVVPTMGEFPNSFDYSTKSFLEAVMIHRENERELTAPDKWSNQMRDAYSDDWKTGHRKWLPNEGWNSLVEGKGEGPLLVANFNTLMSSAGTTYFPKLDNKILLLEEMSLDLGEQERKLTQLKYMGIFSKLKGLIFSKPEVNQSENNPFTYEDLILETIGPNPQFPIITQFDCGHTHPMITLPLGVKCRLIVKKDNINVQLLEPAISV